MRAWTRTKDLLAVSIVTITVVAITSAVHIAQLSRLEVEQASRQAETLAREVFELSRLALDDVGQRESSRAILTQAPELAALMEAHAAHSPYVVYAMITDAAGEFVTGSPAAARELAVQDVPELSTVLELNPLQRMWTLYEHGGVFETAFPLELGGKAFGAIHLGTDTSLIKAELNEALLNSARIGIVALGFSWVAAILVAGVTRRPIRRIIRQIDRLRHGNLDAEHFAWDTDFRELASQLKSLGQEIRSEKMGLLSQKTTLERVINHLQDGVMILNDREEIVSCNQACCGMLNLAFDEVVGVELSEVLPASHPVCRLVRQTVEGEVSEPLRCSLPGAEPLQESLISVLALPAERGSPRGVVVRIQDLSAYDALRTLVEYTANVTAMEQMTSGVVHEVKNPLNVMALQIWLLKKHLQAPPPEVQKSLDVLAEAIRELDKMVREFFEFLRPKPLVAADVDVSALLQSVADLMQPAAAQRGVRMDIAASNDRSVVRGDAGLLRQVFINLVQNALDAMSEGGSLELRSEVAGDRLVVSVRDSGIGIEPGELEKIFRLYYTTKRGGSGIGLSLVQRMIQQHGGRVEVDSRPGEGTTVRVILPLPPLPEGESEGSADGGEGRAVLT